MDENGDLTKKNVDLKGLILIYDTWVGAKN